MRSTSLPLPWGKKYPAIAQRFRMSVRNVIVEYVFKILFGEVSEVPFDNFYPWLNYTFQELMKDPKAQRLPYVWGVIQAAALAKVLKIPRMSVIEFGVAGGNGLLILERIAESVELRTGVGISVFGFDTGHGLPKPQDWRDHPNIWAEGQLPMRREVLESRLKRASLRLGLVRDTVSSFLDEKPAPIGFVSIDLDYYSSTRDALTILNAGNEQLLPRVVCYFDDIMGMSFNDFAGERLAIHEFNESNRMSKLSPIYGLRYLVPRRYRHWGGWESLYFAHLFKHPMYSVQDRVDVKSAQSQCSL
jgi:hypothetical protein